MAGRRDRGVRPWDVARRSLVNKAILIPAALAISALTRWAVSPLLMVGGAYLGFEGFEKVQHKLTRERKDKTRSTVGAARKSSQRR